MQGIEAEGRVCHPRCLGRILETPKWPCMGTDRVAHLIGEQGGWPLTMFLTPAGEPVWGGTYFPKTSRYGRPAFTDVLREVARLFRAEGLSVAAAFGERPLKAQLRMADRAGARYAAIVGDAEAEAESVTLRHLGDGAQETVAASDVVQRVGRAG